MCIRDRAASTARDERHALSARIAALEGARTAAERRADAATSGAETPGGWTGGIALAPLPRDSFSLADVPWPRWQDIVAVFRFR